MQHLHLNVPVDLGDFTDRSNTSSSSSSVLAGGLGEEHGSAAGAAAGAAALVRTGSTLSMYPTRVLPTATAR